MRPPALAAAALLACVVFAPAPADAGKVGNRSLVVKLPPVRPQMPTVKRPVETQPAAPKAATSTSSTSAATAKSSASSTTTKNSATAASAKTQSNQDDDDDDDDAKSGPNSATTSAASVKKAATEKAAETRKPAAKKEAAPEPEPPQTVAEMLARLGLLQPSAEPAPLPKAIPAPLAVARPTGKPAPAWGHLKVAPTQPESTTVKSTAATTAGVASPSDGRKTTATAALPVKTAGAAAAPAGAPGAAPPVVLPVSVGKPIGREVLAPGLSPSDLAKAVGIGFAIAAASPSQAKTDTAVLRLVPPDGMSAAEAHRKLKEALPVGQFFRNQIYRPFEPSIGVPDDGGGEPSTRPEETPDCAGHRCYGPQLLQWRKTLGSCARPVKIGIIDTAHDANHPAFANRRISVARVVPLDRSNVAMAPNWHGTGVLAILAGSPDSTTPGLVPDAHYVVADVFFADSRGQPMSDTSSLWQALMLMDRFGVDVVNMSLSGPRDELIEAEIARMVARGVVFVAAAGNNGASATPSYPAAYKGVIAVTAVNRGLHGYRHANQGSYIDVAAPGVGIWTAMPERKEAYLTGTSFAAPFVTAIAAIMQGQTRGWSKERLLDRLTYKDLGAPGRDPVFGRGLVQAPPSCTPGKGGAFETAVISDGGPAGGAGGGASAMNLKGPASPQR